MSQRCQLSAAFQSVTIFNVSFVLAFLLAAMAPALAQEDPFALGVRNTEPLEPDAQQAAFRLPEGFRIDLVAAEPEIAKPMNMAFDQRGRLWVSSSLEYPFAAAPGTIPRDTITILEDTNGDGRADIVKKFADELNIPIGLYPYKDGVICFSIPNIVFLRDTDGDDKCDVREVLYGPFDTTRDTHGMCNAFRRGEDGWIYACHGFNNRSEVKGRDGNTVVMHSGNTFRFRPDGSRIEHYTIGQVNPFGMAIDRFGDPLTADCHTKPVTLLLQGGNYDSFGKPHDGLGYVPNVMEHLHGSTAIGGIALGEATNFPGDYQQSSFGGNVMTSRINRNLIVRTGSTVKAVEASDLLSTTDPWFRPVDLVAGPDGSLYVADFYNRIIGHYEVDLFHPGRDRHRGRIWKISAVKPGTKAESVTPVAGLSVPQAVAELETSLPERARLIADFVADNHAQESLPLLLNAVRSESPSLRRRSLRLLDRLGALDDRILSKACTDPDALVRVHAFRALKNIAEKSATNQNETAVQNRLRLIVAGFSDTDAMVRRAAVQASSHMLDDSVIPELIRLYHITPPDDVHLRHAIRMSLRDHLRNEAWFRSLAVSVKPEDVELISGVCLALKNPAAGEFVASRLDEISRIPSVDVSTYLTFAASYVDEGSVPGVVQAVRQAYRDQPTMQLQLMESMRTGLIQRGAAVPSSLTDWAQDMALMQLGMKSPSDTEAIQVKPEFSWTYEPLGPRPSAENIWGVTRDRRFADGASAPLYSSFEKGEQRTGILRSQPFMPGEALSFFLAGHDGFPEDPLKMKNVVRLRDSVTGEVLREASPPRNDVGQKVTWNTSELQGRTVVVELVDEDNGSAYAWMAAGRFSDERLNPGEGTSRRTTAAALVAAYRLTELQAAMKQILQSPNLDAESLAACGSAMAAMTPGARMQAVAGTLQVQKASEDGRQKAIAALCDSDPVVAIEALSATAVFATSAEQLRIAEVLATDTDGIEVLAGLVEQGRMSARLLRNPNVQQRISAIAGADMKARIEGLTSGLPDESAAIEALIVSRRESWQQHGGDAAAGAELFKKHCSICHQVAGQGKKVGPNLDGIGNRGLDRVLEDVLAPNRNVDINFRTSTIVTKEGLAINGLARDLEGDRVSIFDSQGRETILSGEDIDERVTASMSPMPANVSEILNEQEFRNLLAWLLTLRH